MRIEVKKLYSEDRVTIQRGHYLGEGKNKEFILESCDHKGADEEKAGEDTYDDPRYIKQHFYLTCDKCGKWQDYDGEWRDD